MRIFTLLTVLLPATAAIASNTLIGQELRILPLGASITNGLHSTTGNGYREPLRRYLNALGATVSFIGTQCSGTMRNGNSEGHPGRFIRDMKDFAAPDIEYKPNVVLVYVGTNDMIFGTVDSAIQDMKSLVKYLKTSLPDSLLVIANLFLDTAHDGALDRIQEYNRQMTTANIGEDVIIVDMFSALGASDLAEGTHPSDQGYQKMAISFTNTLLKSGSLIPKPVSIPDMDNYPYCNGPP